MSTKICTSIEQSKKLLSLGLDPSTADMYYKYVLPKSDKLHHVPNVGEPTNALSWYNKGYTLDGRKEPLELKDFCVPCWSLAALLGLMPDIIKIEEECYTFSLIKNVIEYVGHDGNILYSTGGESFVDAAVKMFELMDDYKNGKL